ncbi:MAG: hypothetical protein AAF555_07110 [Verrucomicrobiota bacterium]
MIENHAGKTEAVRRGGLLVFGVLVLLAVSAGMRESDQASLLDGGLAIARSGSLADQGYYHYGKQFVVYWLLAAVFRVTGFHEVGTEGQGVVLAGNALAAVIFWGGLLALLWAKRDHRKWEGPLLLLFLLAPAVALSAPLLSTIVVSGGFFCGVLWGLRHSPTLLNLTILGLAAFLAIGARQDALLLLPAACLLAQKEPSWRGLFQDGRCWLLGGVAVGTLLLGSWLGQPSGFPMSFFEPKVAAAYWVFGLGALGPLVVLVALAAMGRAVRGARLFWLLTGGALLLPVAFYSLYLYTPRHLVSVAMMFLATLVLPLGRVLWGGLLATRVSRVFLATLLLVTVASWGVGLRLPSPRQPSLVWANATAYPTADGLWPMGAYGPFFFRLSRMDQAPIDHNQDIWEAWLRVPDEELRGRGVFSGGLASVAQLRFRLAGEKVVPEAPEVLADDRSCLREALGHTGGQELDVSVLGDDPPRVMSRSGHRRILLFGARRREPDGRTERFLVEQALARSVFGGDDFVTWAASETGPAWWIRHRGHRCVLLSRRPLAVDGQASQPLPVGEWWGTSVDPAEMALSAPPFRPEDLVAVSVLPTYMSQAAYAPSTLRTE